MPTLRLTHPFRPTLELRQLQRDEFARDTNPQITAEIGGEEETQVYVKSRDTQREVSGLVTGRRRAANDPQVSDDEWQQALANYVDTLESHVDAGQGDGYTLVDDILDVSRDVVIESVSWELREGRPYEIEYDFTVRVGRGTYDEEFLIRRLPTVNTSLDTPIEVDGVACPGLRSLQVERSLQLETKGVFDRDSAESNDILGQSSGVQTVTYEGTHTGPRTERRAADTTLSNLVAERTPITLRTRFPGYDLEGYIISYQSDFRQSFGTGRHDYRLEFVEGQRA